MNTRAAPGVFFVALALVAGVRPLVGVDDDRASSSRASAVWPESFEGARIAPAPLHPVERQFEKGFPGAFAAFTDGRRRIVFREIMQATRKVHPADGCLRAAGYEVKPLPALRLGDGSLWAVCEARKDGLVLHVRECITTHDNSAAWTDVSAWYWAALFHPAGGPWRATTVIEEVR